MLEKLVKVIHRIMPDVDTNNVSIDTRLVDDLGFDSLAMMMLAMEIENEFNVRFDGPVDFPTVGDVVKYLELNAK